MGSTSNSPQIHSHGRFGRRTTGEADRRWSKSSSGSNGDRRWRDDSGRGEAGWGLEEVEEVLGKVLMQGIEVWWPEEGDRRKGATTARALELRSAQDEVRRKKGMTGGSHVHPDKYLGVAWRTVRRPRADYPRGRCYTNHA